MFTEHFFIVHIMRGRVTRDGAICAKNSKFDCFDEASPITEKAIQLQSPTPILAPGSDCFRSACNYVIPVRQPW